MNPLLSREFLIPFNDISPEHIEPGIREALKTAQNELDELIAFTDERDYDNTMQRLDDLTERLSRAVTVAYHLTMVNNSPELRTAFNAVLPEFSSFFAKLPTNDGLWRAIKTYAATPDAEALTGVRRRHLEKTLREFIRAGADLPTDKKARAEAINVELSQLHSTFSDNVLDATNAFEMIITDEADLAGLPESAVAQARENAKLKDKDGYRFTLQIPSYLPFMQYADNRDLRKKMYTAMTNRACEGDLDNTPLIDKILELRLELASLLGYKDFADYRLELNMAKSGSQALDFVRDLTEHTVPYWQNERDEIMAFAKDAFGYDPLEAWDTAYVTEKLRKAKYDLDAEELRPYFPVDRVLSGMFELCEKLFGISISERDIDEVWHPEVTFYDIHGADGTHLGSFYADWFPRESKRGGAWMNGLITGGPINGGPGENGFEPHLGLMVGNFTPPQPGKPALLTHREVETTFHEFGHLLHHCLSRVEVASRAGTSVPRDWVELPSQIMENWTWERDALDLFARHFETGEPIPDDLFDKMQAARTFMGADGQMRQLAYGTVDLELHVNYRPDAGDATDSDAADGDAVAYAQKVMEPFYFRPEFAHTNFITAFSHVFSGGYAAGYYSYKWSEMLDADAFSRFKQEGLFSREVGRDFVEAVLSRGDSDDPDVLFREFMGRDPDLTALLKRNLEADVDMDMAQLGTTPSTSGAD